LSGNLDALRGAHWDAAMDTCGYVPRVVRASAELLADAVGHYTFISSASVYADVTRPGVNETSPVHELTDPTTEVIDGGSYGGLKALCEQAAEAAMPGRVLNVRAGLIVGPHDPTDRFTYWPRRVARGGEVLAPGSPERRVQFIDVRDLAEWMLRMVESNQTGIYNATGPGDPLSMGTFLDAVKRESRSDATFVWASESFLKEQEVTPYTEMPLWIPEELPGFNSLDCSRALGAGLTFRPLAVTVRDTLSWDGSRSRTPAPAAPAPDPSKPVRPPGGMRPEREAALLRAWRERKEEAHSS
jgi:2'-hydroxyisoflavone reductase